MTHDPWLMADGALGARGHERWVRDILAHLGSICRAVLQALIVLDYSVHFHRQPHRLQVRNVGIYSYVQPNRDT